MTAYSSQRRAFLRSAGDALRGSCITLSLPMILTACKQANEMRRRGENFQNLSAEQAMEFEAIAARIIPDDGSPGAREAGVINFIDKVYTDIAVAQAAILDEGLLALQRQTATEYGARQVHDLEPAQLDELLRSIETTPFFLTLRFLTVAGMFCLPEYGGNRAGIGYDLIGYSSQGAWAPPYGYYDADYSERGQ